ncbi:hypothetical protein HYW20_02840 [Candidatus Woesearchaeota archaeon]|nr:hypothetical protein [Candidatus Woesearchaeota archaeon]
MAKTTRLLLSSIVMFVFLMSVAYAAGSKLFFSDVDVKVGGRTSKNLDDGETIDDDAEPGDSVEFKIEVKNNFTNEEDLEIEDISVTVTIEGIDDGDDLEEESTDFDLKAGRDKRVTLNFEVPIEVEEDSFTVLIHAEGDDENGTNQEADMQLELEVNKENHLLKVTRMSLSPAEVSCSRKNVQLSTITINIGNEDEEDITFEVFNPDLGIDLEGQIDELTAEPNEDESRYSKIYSFNVPTDVEAGSYPVTFRASYDNDRKRTEETATLTVNDCAAAKPEAPDETEEETTSEEEEQPVEVITPTTGRTTTTIETEPEIPEGTVVTQEGFLQSNAFVVGIIIAEVAIVIIGIVLVVALFVRRRD